MRCLSSLCGVMMAFVAVGETNVVDGWSYIIVDSEAAITGVKLKGNLTAPSTLGGFPVASIAAGAFADNSNIKTIKLPDGLRKIGDNAFARCRYLTSVTIPSSVIDIGSGAFVGCKIESVHIPQGVSTISESLFCGCSALVSVVIPEGVTAIYERAFEGCQSMTSVTIPSSMTFMGDGAFYKCSNLKAVYINDIENWCKIKFGSGGLTVFLMSSNPLYYANHLFVDGKEIVDLVIPGGVHGINDCAFYNCTGIRSVTFPETVKSVGCTAFGGCKGLSSVEIENGLADIGSSAFAGCSGLTSLTLPCSVTNIGNSAFSFCGKLATVEIPNSVKHIGAMTFEGCSSLMSIEIPNSINVIETWLFRGSGLKAIEIPPNIRSIENGAFTFCSELESLSIPNSVTNVGEKAFLGCNKLGDGIACVDGWVFVTKDMLEVSGSLSVPRDARHISNGAFREQRTLKSVSFPDGFESIGEYAFYGCTGLDSVSFPGTLNYVGYMAFCGCTELGAVCIEDLKSWCGVKFSYESNPCLYSKKLLLKGKEVVDLNLPNGTANIGDYAFDGCETIKTVNIPEGVESIGSSAFYGCKGISSVTVPKGVTNIGATAFGNCCNLKSVVIPKEVNRIGYDAFLNCSGLEAVYISDLNAWCLIEFRTFAANPLNFARHLYLNGLEVVDIVVPEGIVQIKDYAFIGCTGVRSVKLPDTVTSIGIYAFIECSSLISLSVPESVTQIRWGAFGGCEKLEYVNLPKAIKNIEDSVFISCKKLSEIIIPENVTNISECAFYGCEGLESVTIPPSVVSVAKDAFKGCSELVEVRVWKGDVERVKGLYAWPSNVEFKEEVGIAIDGDPGATVTGDAENGYVIRPSCDKTNVAVVIPSEVDASKVVVEISTKVESVKPNGAQVKIVNGADDITDFLDIPMADGDGVIDLTQATVKAAIVKEAMDIEKGAVIILDVENPKLITSSTRKGLRYQLREGATLDGMVNGDCKIGDGNPWSPTITVSGGCSAFYSIGVGKGE